MGNGIEILKELKLHAINIPVIIMSSHIQMDYISKALENGAFHFLKKPLRWMNLAHTSSVCKTDEKLGIVTDIQIGCLNLHMQFHALYTKITIKFIFPRNSLRCLVYWHKSREDYDSSNFEMSTMA